MFSAPHLRLFVSFWCISTAAAVIISSVLVFGNTLTTTNKIGTAIALVGVGLYSQVKRWKPKLKTAVAGADATA